MNEGCLLGGDAIRVNMNLLFGAPGRPYMYYGRMETYYPNVELPKTYDFLYGSMNGPH